MAVNKKITECTSMGATVPASVDLLPVVDISDTTDDPTGTSKKWPWLDFLRELFATRFGADAGSNDTYVVTLSPAPAAYVTGEHYRFKANTANTGTCTVNFNSLGAKTIKKAAGGITTDLADNDIRAGQWVDLVYDGTNMQMQSMLGNAPSGGTIGGSTGSTDNAVLRADGTGGSTVQSSNLTIPDDAASTEVGYMNVPQNSQSANYTTVLSDRGGHIYHPTSDDNPRTWTIDSNANVAYAIGTVLTFVNDQNTITIAITSDTLVWAEDGSTGSRTLAENGIATALKVTSTRWIISGTGLS
jgi:hypothetical protein